MPRSPRFFWIAAIIVAWAFDFLFWRHTPGLSLLIWVVLGLAAGFFLAFREQVRPAPLSYVLAGVILLLGLLTVLRSEMLTIMLSTAGTLGGMLLLVMTFRSGDWARYRLADYPVAVVHMIGAAFARPARLTTPPLEGEEVARPKAAWLHSAAPYLRGLLIAVPVVLILGALLASADLVFNRAVQDFARLFDLQRLPEYIFRLFYILILAYLLTGLLVHAVLPKRQAEPGRASQVLKPFLGSIESLIVLIAVDALFVLFVAIQFRYLFGGQANITAAGFTYSEYARRGFSELVGVAVLSVGLFLTLATFTRMETSRQKRAFTIAAVALLLLVLVILSSALQRLLLYQNAYGFTRLRTYTFFFIPWLALLLLGCIALQVLNRRGQFALMLGMLSLGFVLTLGLANVDGFIVRQNVARAQQGQELDAPYLATLSADAVPVLFEAYNNVGQGELQQQIAVALSCRANQEVGVRQDLNWRAYNLAEANARRLYQQQASVLQAYPVTNDDSGWYVTLPSGLHSRCFTPRVD